MVSLGVGLTVLGPSQPQGQLGAEHRGDTNRARRLGEADHAVEPVVIGEGEGLQAEPGRFLGERLRRAGTVEEAEVGVGVELGVGRGAGVAGQLRRWDIGLAVV